MKPINWIKSNYLLTIILTVAAILRFYHIDFQSVWIDEIHTLNESNPSLSLSGLYDAILSGDPHPPLYFILVHFFFKIFGYSTFVARMFSALVGLAGVAAIYFFGKELFNKRVGIYSAILLTVNYFHLFYSQEARMYSLLFLTTILSFYFLVRFIKVPTIKSSIIYGVFSAIMIYCHFFALFCLIAQYLILLFFVIRPINSTGKKIFYYSIISGITALILYLPVYGIFMKAAERTTIWITMPTLDVYTQIFKDLFGQSEMVLVLVLSLIIIFVVQLAAEGKQDEARIHPDENRLIFTFFILSIWISITVLIPLIRTYTSLPMLINRYFINVLPAIIIIISIGLSYIKNQVVRYGCLFFIVVFSITDIVIVKEYYTKVDKEQFREVSQFILENNSNHDPVVSNLGWYFPFFLNNESVKTTIFNKPLEDFVKEFIQDTSKITSFWHVEIGNHELPFSNETKQFLENKFVKKSNVSVFRGKAAHYVTISNAVTETDLSKFKPFKNRNGDDFIYYIDSFTLNANLFQVSGFAFFNDQDSKDSSIELVLIEGEKTFSLQVQREIREDVTTYFKSQNNLDNSGFSAKLLIDQLSPGKYQLGIILRDKRANKEGLVLCDNFFTK